MTTRPASLPLRLINSSRAICAHQVESAARWAIRTRLESVDERLHVCSHWVV